MGLRDWYRRHYAFNVYLRDAWVAEHARSIPPGSRVLDVGAGRGRYRRLFDHCEYRAHDFGQEPATLGEYTPLDYQSDITAIPVAAGSFDVVLCTEVLEHVPEPAAALRELVRIVKERGLLLITAPLGASLHQEPYHFYGGYTPYWYRHYLAQAGCTVLSLEPNGGFFSFFGQEALRFSGLVDPRRTWNTGPARWLGATLIWAVTFPILRVLPAFAAWLDSLELEHETTVGYHIVATKDPIGARAS